MSNIPRRGADALGIDAILAGLDEAGCAVIERCVDADKVAALTDELAPFRRAS